MIPSLLAYPEILPLDQVPEIKGRLVYIIENYVLSGESILFFSDQGKIGIKVGDWDGNSLDIDTAKTYKYIEPLMNLVVFAKIPQAQFYFSGEVLVDIRTSLDKMAGPGMINDICAKIVPTQKIIETKKLDDFNGLGNVIIKNSTFQTIIRNDKLIPLYATHAV